MNNSKLIIDNLNITLEPEVNITTRLRERESELVKLIETITRVSSNRDWIALKELLFDGLVGNLDKRLKDESERDELSSSRIHQLQGELKWARRYSDLSKLTESFRKELVNVRSQLKANQ